MNQEQQIAVIERLLDLVERRTTDLVDAQGTVRVDDYLDPDRLRSEVEKLFRGLPVILGHASSAAAPGDYFTHDAAGLPVLVVRGRDHRLRAFLNVCRHRGARVVNESCGAGKNAFACPYHGWTYSVTGQLAGVPHRYGFPEIEMEKSGLVELPVEERCGLIWAVLTPGAAIDVARYLGPLENELNGYGMERHIVYESRVIDRALNWKLGFDIFLEGYHVRRTHQDTIAPVFLDNVGLYDAFPPHLRNLFPKRTITELRGQDRRAWDLRRHANVLYVLFPNTALLVQPDHLSVLHAFPLGPSETRTLAYTLIPEPATSDKARGHWDANNAIFYGAIEEDYEMGQSIQRGLASGANRVLTFGCFEQALTRFHQTIAQYLADETRRSAGSL